MTITLFLLIMCMAINSFNSIESISSFCPEIEKQALLTFKKSLNNPTNHLISSWNTEEVNCCKWKGVVCSNITGHVHQLHLRSLHDSQSLHGKVNLSTLLHLKHLNYLDLSQNHFQGPISSSIASFTNLEYLNLSRSGFHGRVPHDMGNLSSLHTLVLEGSHLHVDGLEWLSGLVQLKHLNMNSVDLKKGIKNWLEIINTLPCLVELHLSGCNLELLSPSPHVNLTSLTFLDLSRNEFDSFSIAKWIFRQSNLIFLDLSRNYIKGTIPSTSNTTKLQHIDLSGNRLTSTIPNWLYFCKDLKLVFLGNNSLNGTISNSIGNLTSLETLSLRYNAFSGQIPREITKLCKLQRLDLSVNKLEGEISDSFGNMSQYCFLGELRLLRLRQNRLSGHLTDQFGDFRNLRYFDLTKNSVSGAIPSTLGKLSKLNTLWLGFNRLSGELPLSIGKLCNLKSLSIGRNMLEGVVNETHFSSLKKLKYLFASGNNLALKVSPDWVPPFQLEEIGLGSWDLGTVPEIPSWIDHMKRSVSVLDLSDAGLSGNVPSWFWDIRVLNLSHNQFHGEIPDFKPGKNHLVFPHYLRRIYLSSNRFSGLLPRVSSDMIELDLSDNSFSDGLSRLLCDVRNEDYVLKILHLGENLLSGEIPDCLAKWSSLEYLNFGNNMLFGRIPNSIGFLTNLLSLNLYGNKLLGQIPFSLHKCTKLVKIDFGGNGIVGSIPKWMGTSLSNLMILILKSNKFSGDIPSTICHLHTLQILDLSYNDFVGEIPNCFQDFTAMATIKDLEGNGPMDIEYSAVFDAFLESVYVDTKGLMLEYHTFLVLVTNINLSNNNLSGEIPEEITSLVELKSLKLARNHLKGSIPRGIGDMWALESLDLSGNSLSGEIPISITKLSFLSYLNLSYNFLNGEIPESTQLSTMDSSSFVGNDLCGPPLPFSCDEGSRAHEENDEGDGSEVDWFYVLVVLGYVVGFIGVCSMLVLNGGWREAYFGWWERVWDKICVCSTIRWVRLKESFYSKTV